MGKSAVADDKRETKLLYIDCPVCNKTLGQFEGKVFVTICGGCGNSVVANISDNELRVRLGRRSKDVSKTKCNLTYKN